MRYPDGGPPRHGHRTPAELAEDELLAALQDDFCGMPEAGREKKPEMESKRRDAKRLVPVRWADRVFAGN